MKFGPEKCAILIIRSREILITGGIEQPNQERIRTSGEKETYKYLGLLKVETIRQVVMKEKIKKNISKKRESYSKPSYMSGTL